MLSTAVVLAAVVALASCNTIGNHPELQVDASLNLEWSVYKERHNKKYGSADEELTRRLAWEDNLKLIEKHNTEYAAGKHTYTLGANKFADLTNAEYRQKVLMRKFDGTQRIRPGMIGHIGENPTVSIPDSVDWRTKGYVTPVKNQEQCGSCWSFSATGSMEGQHFAKKGKLVSLSEQNLMDCSVPEGNQGCDGGLMDQAFEYVIKNKGIDTEAFYPYTAQDGTCHYSPTHIGATISSYMDIPTGDEMTLTNDIATIGPISVAIDASQSSFQLYSGGVYNEPACSSTQLDHGVLAVGYASASGQDYYIVKNSWGGDWGMSGYIWMSRNMNNQCGIATAASYPIV